MDTRTMLEHLISDLVSIPSPSGQEDAVSQFVYERLVDSGLSPCRDADGNVWVETGPRTGDLLHVNGHLDTVVPADGWQTDPFRPVVRGDCLYGLGSSDCKGGLAAMLILAPRVKPKVRTIFSFTVCEEGGDHKENGSRRMASLGGRWAITVEPSCRPDGVCVSLGTQGHARAVVRFAGKSAHSSRPDLGENAIVAAARFVLAIEELNASFLEHEVFAGVRSRASAAATLISGGRLMNMIPDSCEVTVSRRLAPGESEHTFRAELDRILAGEKASYQVWCDGPCAMVDTAGVLFGVARDAMREVAGGERFGFQRGRTDAVIYAARGMDTITIGPGQSGQSHCANEFINLAVAADCVALLEAVINRLG